MESAQIMSAQGSTLHLFSFGCTTALNFLGLNWEHDRWKIFVLVCDDDFKNFTALTHYKIQTARTKIVNTETWKFAVGHIQLSNICCTKLSVNSEYY